jgi:hypothetical protein
VKFEEAQKNFQVEEEEEESLPSERERRQNIKYIFFILCNLVLITGGEWVHPRVNLLIVHSFY